MANFWKQVNANRPAAIPSQDTGGYAEWQQKIMLKGYNFTGPSEHTGYRRFQHRQSGRVIHAQCSCCTCYFRDGEQPPQTLTKTDFFTLIQNQL